LSSSNSIPGKRAFLANGIQAIRIKTQDLEDRRSHLSGFHKAVNGPAVDARVRYQPFNFGIVRAYPPCSDFFLSPPVYTTPTFGITTMSGIRGSPLPQVAAGARKVGNAGWVKERV
jgi:hypothetical protein